MHILYNESQRLYDIVTNDNQILQIMSRMGLPLGFGEKTVKQTCEEANVDTITFLALANYYKEGREIANYFVDKISVSSLMDYLTRSHHYFNNFLLPYIRRLLIEAINCCETNKVAFLIIKFYDEYMDAVKHHTVTENTKIFPIVRKLLEGTPQPDFHISALIKSHDGMDKKISELRNIILKYYTSPNPSHQEQLYSVLQQIFNLEADMKAHCELEELLFVPAVELLEERVLHNPTSSKCLTQDNDDISDREKEIVGCIAMGLTNKEIANRLFISTNTVITHRKNIARKLNIRTAAGLTIYAITNKIVNLEDIKDIN